MLSLRSYKPYSLLCAIISSALIIVSIIVGYRFLTIKRSIIQQVQSDALQQTKTGAQEISEFIEQLKIMVSNLAEQLSTTDVSQAELEKSLMNKPVDVYGFGVAFLPNKYYPSVSLYAPYAVDIKGKSTLIDIGTMYDYTDKDVDWFWKPITYGAGFIPPYKGKSSETVISEYSAPIYDSHDSAKDRKPIGIVFANQSIQHLNYILSSLYLGNTGYWFILDQYGRFLAHPNYTLTEKQQKISDLATTKNDPIFRTIEEKIKDKSPLFMTYNNEITGESSWLFGEPIASTGWTLFRVFDIGELSLPTTISSQQLPDFERQHIMTFITILSIALIGIVIAASSFWFFSPTLLWTISCIISLILALHLTLLWYVAGIYPDYKPEIGFVQSKRELLNRMSGLIESTINPSTRKHTPLTNLLFVTEQEANNIFFIPTGILINDLKFETENEINITGYIWQRYTNGIHDEITKGFMLPQASRTKIRPLYEKKYGNYTTMVWQVDATLNQNLSYERYPFDVKDLQIEIWPNDLNTPIMLIPDLDSYDLINPRSLPGIGTDAYLEGWRLKGSYFGYKNHQYKTNFGLYVKNSFGIINPPKHIEVPDLYFNIMASRTLIDTFMEDLLPLAVIALLLFMTLITSMEQGYGVLASCASVFFGTVFSQLHFREKVPAYQLVYFESFYLIMYVLILVIVIISLLYILRTNITVIQYRNNIISQLLFWPLTLASLIIFTLWYLY